MQLDKLIEVNGRCRSKRHYLDLGYIEENGKFFVRPDDLLKNSGVLETRICDNCYKEFTRRHEHHVITFERFGKDLCGECVKQDKTIRTIIQTKKEEAWDKKYGGHPMHNRNVREKLNQTFLERYNGHPMKNKEIREKVLRTVNEKYGGNSPQCSPIVREKTIKSLYGNGDIPTSIQQKTLKTMIEKLYPDAKACVLNYPLSALALDIKLEINDINIDIEYDGKYWHKDKANQDRRRDEFVKTQGYKILRIKSNRLLPTEEELKEALSALLTTSKRYKEIILPDW